MRAPVDRKSVFLFSRSQPVLVNHPELAALAGGMQPRYDMNS